MTIALDVERVNSLNTNVTQPRTVTSQGSESVNKDPIIPGHNGQQPPPPDGGKGAWLFLAGCFMFEALIWGFPFSFGVFQSYYTTHPPFAEHPRGIAIVGTCATGVMYLFAPISLYALEAWPTVRRLCSVAGLVIAVSALLASSFATRVWHLVVTQGILYAVGGSLLYSPTMFYLDGWFVRRKGLAFGIMWAGVGTSGLIFPFLLTVLLNSYGFPTTLRIYAIILFTLCSPLIYYIKPRIPFRPPSPPNLADRFPVSSLLTSSSCGLAASPPSLLFNRTFITLQACNIIESLGFFLPAIFIPSYTLSLGMPAIYGTILLAILNIFSVVGAIALGSLCDRMSVGSVLTISSVGAAVAVLVFWGLGGRMEILAVFVVAYGVFAGGFSAIWASMMTEVQTAFPTVHMSTLMGLFSAGRGIGAISSGPISEALLAWAAARKEGVDGSGFGSGSGSLNESGSGVRSGLVMGYESDYAVLIVFTGLTALLSGCVGVEMAWRGRKGWRRGG